MKKLSHFLVLILVLPSLVFGQTTTDNTLDAQFSNPTSLTDKQMDDAKNFVHQGQKDRAYKEGCAKADGCKDPDDGFPLEQVIGKAYAMIGMFGGGAKIELKPTTPTTTPANPPAAPADGAAKAGEAKPDERNDYCIMMAMAYEAVGGIIQQSLQKKADATATAPGDQQIQSLISLRETHKARQKTATFQATIYTGVTACYVGMLATGAAFNTSFGLKMGGSAALMGLYWKKVAKHKKAAGLVDEVIASMNNAGKNCDPWTKTPCFCSEATSKDTYLDQYQEVCVLNKGNFETPKIALGCVASGENNTMSYDKECKCKATNSCVKSNLKGLNPNFSLGTNAMAEANKAFNVLNTGDLDEGNLQKASMGLSAAAAGIKGKAVDKIKSPALTVDQKKMADELKQYMPENIAGLGSTASGSGYKSGITDSAGLSAASLGKLPASVKEKLSKAISGGYRQGGGPTSYTSDEPEFTMPKFGAQEPEQSSGTEVLTFADQATSKAEISNAPTTPIFDLISNRYRMSGWKKLGPTETK